MALRATPLGTPFPRTLAELRSRTPRASPRWLTALFAPAVVLGCGSSDHGQSTSASPSLDARAEPGATNPGGGDDASVPEIMDAGGPVVADAGAPEDTGAGAATADDSSPPDGGQVASPAGDAGAPYKGVANSPCADLVTLRAAWYYNWTTSSGKCTATEFIPMIWGHTGDEQSASGISKEIDGIANGGYRIVLGFNEPDNSSQSNISVATAISLWPSFTGNPSLRVGSPATQANSSGQAWFKSFMQDVDADTTGKLRVDFIAAHWYGWNSGSCDNKAASLESYIRWLEGLPGQRPIWLTEWGCLNQSNPSADVVQAFFSGAVAMFAKHPRIERYAWYPWTTNNELITNGAPTSLGTAFAALPAFK
jgi:hypothetical protein